MHTYITDIHMYRCGASACDESAGYVTFVSSNGWYPNLEPQWQKSLQSFIAYATLKYKYKYFV
jgi:hypothetical protein